MKRSSLAVGIWIALAGVVWALDDGAGAYRIFTSKEGRTIEGRIVKYDAQKGKIQMERRGAGFVWVTPDVFDEADQTYIKEWVAADLFLSESKLGISVEEHARSVGKSRKNLIKQTTGIVYYEILLENRSDITFNHLKFDYQLYIGKRMYRGGSARPRCVTGMVKLKSLSAGSKKKCMTKPAELITQYSSDYSFNDETHSISKSSKEVPQGVLIRLEGPSVGGVPVMREFAYPPGFGEKVEWSESTDKKESKPAGALTYDELIQKARAHKYGSGVKKDYKKAIALYEQASELDPTKAEENAYNIFDIRLKMRTVSSHSLAEEWAEKKTLIALIEC